MESSSFKQFVLNMAYRLDNKEIEPDQLYFVHVDLLPMILKNMINNKAKTKLEDYIIIRKLGC